MPQPSYFILPFAWVQNKMVAMDTAGISSLGYLGKRSI